MTNDEKPDWVVIKENVVREIKYVGYYLTDALEKAKEEVESERESVGEQTVKDSKTK